MDFFTSLYEVEAEVDMEYATKGCFLKLQPAKVANLNATVSGEEIKVVLSDMYPYKASGIDGFRAVFYQRE